MGQWMLNLLHVTRNPEQIERMSYSRMRWWNERAEKIIDQEVIAAGGKPSAHPRHVDLEEAREVLLRMRPMYA